jgi:hypothetical protein
LVLEVPNLSSPVPPTLITALLVKSKAATSFWFPKETTLEQHMSKSILALLLVGILKLAQTQLNGQKPAALVQLVRLAQLVLLAQMA